jgi:hypothetical protein
MTSIWITQTHTGVKYLCVGYTGAHFSKLHANTTHWYFDNYLLTCSVALVRKRTIPTAAYYYHLYKYNYYHHLHCYYYYYYYYYY